MCDGAVSYRTEVADAKTVLSSLSDCNASNSGQVTWQVTSVTVTLHIGDAPENPAKYLLLLLLLAFVDIICTLRWR